MIVMSEYEERRAQLCRWMRGRGHRAVSSGWYLVGLLSVITFFYLLFANFSDINNKKSTERGLGKHSVTACTSYFPRVNRWSNKIAPRSTIRSRKISIQWNTQKSILVLHGLAGETDQTENPMTPIYWEIWVYRDDSQFSKCRAGKTGIIHQLAMYAYLLGDANKPPFQKSQYIYCWTGKYSHLHIWDLDVQDPKAFHHRSHRSVVICRSVHTARVDVSLNLP